jgi:hypothetical protein
MEDPAAQDQSLVLNITNWVTQHDIRSLTYLFTWCVVPHGPGRASPGNLRSGMSRSRQLWIRQLSHLAAWSIWVTL